MHQKVVVVGGAGALGSALIQKLSAIESSPFVLSVDYTANPKATDSLILSSPSESLPQLIDRLGVEAISTFTAVYCVAGGWQGGGGDAEDLLQCGYDMWQMNGQSSLLALGLASKLLTKDPNITPILQMTSAKASLHGTPAFVAYGMAKAAVNHLVRESCAEPERVGLPKNTRVFGVLPEVLDTEANRRSMPNAPNRRRWIPLERLADFLVDRLVDPPRASGSLYTIYMNEEGKFVAETV